MKNMVLSSKSTVGSINKKGFTLIELLVVITIVAILAVGGTAIYTKNIADGKFSTDNSTVQSLAREVSSLFIKDTAFVNGAKSLKFDTIASEFTDIGGTVTLADMKSMISTAIPGNADLGLIQICPQSVTNANLDTNLILQTSAKYTELVIFLKDTSGTPPTTCYANISDISGKKVAGTLLRYKNNTVTASDDYGTSLLSDGGARWGAIAVNTAGENVFGVFSRILRESTPIDFTPFY